MTIWMNAQVVVTDTNNKLLAYDWRLDHKISVLSPSVFLFVSALIMPPNFMFSKIQLFRE